MENCTYSKEELEKRIDIAVKILKKCNNIIAFTGAGISTESGIPDFRGKDGVWKKIDPKTATLQYFNAHPEKYWGRAAGLGSMMPIINEVTENLPNNGHFALAKLIKSGKLKSIITQNVDNLHQKANEMEGVSQIPVVELHGTMLTAHCLKCNEKYLRKDVIQRVRNGENPPTCLKENCDGLLKTDTILFGEQLPQKAIEEAFDFARNCDCVIVLGSSLVVFPAANVPLIAKERGAKFLIINYEPTDMDFLSDLTINGPIGKILPEIVKRIEL
ncbi:MAG: NAD-dependent deacylase [Candidatus Lokiarchaeota archaeon]|nr:NAD-dependent deacylase [Candidatus Lokiarchaeota archaeon]